MKERRTKSKTGIMIRLTLTKKEMEEAKKHLFQTLDKIYENHKKNH